jgi:hypothetical protein
MLFVVIWLGTAIRLLHVSYNTMFPTSKFVFATISLFSLLQVQLTHSSTDPHLNVSYNFNYKCIWFTLYQTHWFRHKNRGNHSFSYSICCLYPVLFLSISDWNESFSHWKRVSSYIGFLWSEGKHDSFLALSCSILYFWSLIFRHFPFVISDNGFCLIEHILILHCRLIKVNNWHSRVHLIAFGCFIYVLRFHNLFAISRVLIQFFNLLSEAKFNKSQNNSYVLRFHNLFTIFREFI